ncbi:hypothetical protein BC628DRAFT_341761 [Trametes gibbosa]|nr:hypothetical protein BC628DRAFT_341761 [Trametes gibbosa]
MSSQIPSSSFPVPPTFQQDGDPAQFLDWMQGQKDVLLNDPELAVIQKRPEWLETLSSLLHTMSLPSPAEIPWTAMHEPNRFAEMSLSLVHGAAQRVPSLFAGDEVLAQALFATVTTLCASLDQWIDADVPEEKDYLSPVELYMKATNCAASLIQAMGGEILPKAITKADETVKNVLNRCLALVDGLLSSEGAEFPMVIEVSTLPEVIKRLPSSKVVLQMCLKGSYLRLLLSPRRTRLR